MLIKRLIFSFIIISFALTSVMPPRHSYAQTVLNLPVPGTMVMPTKSYFPAIIKGITIHPENPLEFDFIVDSGDFNFNHGDNNDDRAQDIVPLREESKKLIKYFLASLTTPEEETWVNLSPYEKNRIIPEGFGQTEMGRDLLAQDYLLKQLTASLMYPEDELGSDFWEKIYEKAMEKYGTTEIPMDTFNKVWIVPEKAAVYEHENSAFVVESHLKVMLEEDYVAQSNQKGSAESRALSRDLALEHTNKNRRDEALPRLDPPTSTPQKIATNIIREIIIPAIEQEVNQGQTFAQLRQIYHSMILATWYKINLKDSLLGQVYMDKNKTKGVDAKDKQINQKIYNRYIESFKKGVYDYIREDYNPSTQNIIPRKYFSGGISSASSPTFAGLKSILVTLTSAFILSNPLSASAQTVSNNLTLEGSALKVGVALEEVSNEGAKRHILPDSLETSHLSQTPKGSEQVTEDETEHQAASLPATSSPLEDTRAKGVNGLVYEELPSPLLKDGHNVAKGMNISNNTLSIGDMGRRSFLRSLPFLLGGTAAVLNSQLSLEALTQQTATIPEQARAFLYVYMQYALRGQVSIFPRNDIAGWKELLSEQVQTVPVLRDFLNAIVNNDELLEEFVDLFFATLFRAQALLEVQSNGSREVTLDESFATALRLLSPEGLAEFTQAQKWEVFFKGNWSAYIVALGNGDIESKRMGQQLMIEARDVDPDLAVMVEKLVNQIDSPETHDVLIKDWRDFNARYLIPREIYGSLDILFQNISSGRRYFYAPVIYRIVDKEPYPLTGDISIDVIYGRKMDRTMLADPSAGVSLLGNRFVFIDADDIDAFADTIMETLNGGDFNIIFGNTQIRSPLINEWIRGTFLGKQKKEIVEIVKHSFKAHELAHKAKELLGIRYNLREHFGIPDHIWNNMDTRQRESVDFEVSGYLAQIAFTEYPGIAILSLFSHFFAGPSSRVYFPARYIFNRIFGIENRDNWINTPNPEALIEEFLSFANKFDIREIALKILKEGYPDIDQVRDIARNNPTDSTMRHARASAADAAAIAQEPAFAASPVKDGSSPRLRNKKDNPESFSAVKGGIDFNPGLMDMQIKRDGNGVPLPVFQQPIESMNIEGFVPVIINISPVTNFPALLGFDHESEDSEDYSFMLLQPMDKRDRVMV